MLPLVSLVKAFFQTHPYPYALISRHLCIERTEVQITPLIETSLIKSDIRPNRLQLCYIYMYKVKIEILYSLVPVVCQENMAELSEVSCC